MAANKDLRKNSPPLCPLLSLSTVKFVTMSSTLKDLLENIAR